MEAVARRLDKCNQSGNDPELNLGAVATGVVCGDLGSIELFCCRLHWLGDGDWAQIANLIAMGAKSKREQKIERKDIKRIN